MHRQPFGHRQPEVCRLTRRPVLAHLTSVVNAIKSTGSTRSSGIPTLPSTHGFDHAPGGHGTHPQYCTKSPKRWKALEAQPHQHWINGDAYERRELASPVSRRFCSCQNLTGHRKGLVTESVREPSFQVVSDLGSSSHLSVGLDPWRGLSHPPTT